MALANPSNADIDIGEGIGSIVNDDPLPELSIDSVSHDEGNSGKTTYTFTVSLSAASGRTVRVDWSAADDTATLTDSDYQNAGGTLTFAPDATTRTFTVSVTGDLRNEIDETFLVNLASPSNADIEVGTGTGDNRQRRPGCRNCRSIPFRTMKAIRARRHTRSRCHSSAASGRTVTVDWSTA